MFDNLIGNALKFTRTGGITVAARREGGHVVFSVTDTGPGIPPDQSAHAFDRFWQARRTTREGAGLGLFIVKGIVEAHGGRVWVESQRGVGSTFFFTLPVCERATEDEPVLAPPQQTAPTGGCASVLVAEDDRDVREGIVDLLGRLGYEAVAVSNGQEAVSRLHEAPSPGLVILDLTMPVMDGWAVLAARKEDARLRDVPVIVVSAEPAVAERVAAADARFLAKPVTLESLQGAIRAITEPGKSNGHPRHRP